MAFARVYSAQTQGLSPHVITVEVDLARGLHAFAIVGLPDKAVEESRDRVTSAVKNTGFPSPKHNNKKIVASLSPADIKKEGAFFDVPVALAYLLSAQKIEFDPAKKLFVGELSLDGSLRPVKGVLLLTQKAKQDGYTEIYVPRENAREAALVDGITVYGADTLDEIIRHINTHSQECGTVLSAEPWQGSASRKPGSTSYADIADVRGQETAKRALEIAACGRHNIAFYGPPGTGKTMLAKALAGILPELSFEEGLEVTGIHSVSGTLSHKYIHTPPFRAPHHTASYVSIIGGGSTPRPGEATLAHRGVLFLDEFPEFDRRVIESLREPMEEGEISITRAQGNERFPAQFILVAAMNLCPCGNTGTHKACRCTPSALERYRRKISGPIIDRIDLWIHVPPVPQEILTSAAQSRDTSSREISEKIEKAQHIQRARFENTRTQTNAEIPPQDLDTYIQFENDARTTLDNAMHTLELSARSYHRMMRVAQTIADLEDSPVVTKDHVLEALQYRPQAPIID